jgi:hypothetical protein
MKALACTLVAILAMVWPPAAAVALDITFDDVIRVNNPLLTTLDIHGYRFTGLFRTIDTPGGTLPRNGSAVYLHQAASGPGITLTRADGGAFILYEFDAVGQASLVGHRVGGGLLNATYGLSTLLPGFVHFSVPSAWSDLQAVTFSGLLAAATPGALPLPAELALDDVGVGEGPTSVAEPATLALALLTALGGCVVALARHRGGAFRHR